MRSIRLTAAIVVFIGLTTATFAGDEPHWLTFGTECASCHAGHKAAGSSLTTVAGNANVCNS